MPRKLVQIGQAYSAPGKAVVRQSERGLELLDTVPVTIRMYREHGAAQRWFSMAFNNVEGHQVEIFVPMEALAGQGDTIQPLKAAVFVD